MSEFKQASERAVRPKDAATLIIVRRGEDDGGLRVLMGKRDASHKFMPNKYVFPGGKVDAADGRIVPLTQLSTAVEAKLLKGCSVNKARALAMAAVRETWEEAGLLVGIKSEKLPNTQSTAWADFLQQGVVPSLDCLELIARAITPPHRTRRFDTRFFAVEAEHVLGIEQGLQRGSGELLAMQWVTFEEALTLDLPKITRFILDHLQKRLIGETDAVPFIYARRGKQVLESL